MGVELTKEEYKQIRKSLKANAKKNMRGQEKYIDDVVNKTLMKLFENKKYDPKKSSKKTYANLMLRTQISNFHKSRKTKKNNSIVFDNKDVISLSGDVDEGYSDVENLTNIELFEKMYPKEGKVIREFYVNGEVYKKKRHEKKIRMYLKFLGYDLEEK